MADLRIADAPEIDESEVQGGLKLPTGGFGNKAINMNTVANWVVKDKDLPSKGYVDDKFNQGNQGLAGHVANKNNPHEVTKEQVGLGNVDNTADADKPISNATSAALNLKADKTQLQGLATTTQLDLKADKSTTYTKTEVDGTIDDLYQSIEDNFVANGAALPYDPQVTYNDGAIVVDNGVLKKVEGGTLVNAVEAENISVGDSTLDVFAKNQIKRTYSLTDAGALGGGANDTVQLQNAISVTNRLNLDTDNSQIDQAIVKKSIELYGTAALTQPTQNKPILYFGWQQGDVGFTDGSFVEKPIVKGIKLAGMPEATTDDFAALTLSQCDAPVVNGVHFEDVENGVRLSTNGGLMGREGFGTRDALILGTTHVRNRRFCVQILQASYNKIIGVTSHNNGDNTFFAGDATENQGGRNAGIRLAGLGEGNIANAINLRDKGVAVTLQRGNKYNIINSAFINNSLISGVSSSSSNQGYGGRHIASDIIVKDSAAESIRTAYLANSRFSGIVANSQGYAVNNFPQTTNDTSFILYFTDGSGNTPLVGTTLTQGAVTFKVVAVRNEALTVVTSAALPSKGTIVVDTVSGGRIERNVAVSGLSAVITDIEAGDGRNRYDCTVVGAKTTAIRLGTDCNIGDFITSNNDLDDLVLDGSYNIIRITSSEMKASRFTRINGNNNIILLTDNTQDNALTTLNISGNNNIILGSTKARIAVSGSGNTGSVQCARLTYSSTSSNNDIGGVVGSVVNSGANNNLSKLRGGQTSGVISLTTNALGQFDVPHGLITTAKSFVCNIQDTTELLHVQVLNVANSTTTSRIQVYKADGTAAANKEVNISFIANI